LDLIFMYDIKVEQLESIRNHLLSNRSCDTFMSYTDQSAQKVQNT